MTTHPCAACGRTELDEDDHAHPVTCPACVGKIRTNLATIEALHDRLGEEATHHPTDSAAHAQRLDVMGGDAMWMAGPAAATAVDLSTGRHVDDDGTAATSGEHPLLVLAGWEDVWREWTGQPTSLRATIARAVDYLDANLTRMAQARPHPVTDEWPPPIDEFADDVNQAVSRLEDVLREGRRPIRSVRCLGRTDGDRAGEDCAGQLRRSQHDRRPHCRHVHEAIRAGLLPREWVFTLASYPELGLEHAACDQGGARDEWVCAGSNGCGRRYDTDEHDRAVAEANNRRKRGSQGGRLRTAADVEQALGVDRATVRQWATRGHVDRQGRDGSGRVLYDVEQVRRHAMRGGLLAS